MFRASLQHLAGVLRSILQSFFIIPIIRPCSFCFLLSIQFTILSKAVGNDIMIISSDMSVAKYSEAQNAFKETIVQETVDVDLGQKSVTESKIEKMISDNDPDLIYCIGSRAYLVASKFAKDKNLILTSAINWQRFSLTEKTFGVANELSTGMQLTLFRYFFPEIEKIGVLYSKKYNKEWLEQAIIDGKDVGVEIIGKRVSRPKDINRALKKLLPKVDAVWLTSDPVVLAEKDSVAKIFTKTDKMKKPVFSYNSAFASYGTVLMISADIPTIGRQAASLAEEISGNTPVDEKFQPPAGSSITLNMKMVEEYGIKLNRDALDSVNKIIQ